MTEWLEFHDSTLTAVLGSEAHVEVLLDAYIHRWEHSPGGWKGTGWGQRVRIVVSRPTVLPATPLLPLDISDGRLQHDTVTYDNVVRLPFRAAGTIRLWLQLSTADVVEVTGSAVHIDGTEPARFIEDLPPDWRLAGGDDDRS